MPALDEPAAVAPSGLGETTGVQRRMRTAVLLFAAIALGEVLRRRGSDAAVTPWWVSIVYPLFFFVAADVGGS
jgi:hypothetical protein